LAEGAYSFALSDEEGKVVAHATNDADGSFRFSGVSIDSAWVGQAKTYHVQEENTGEKYVRYDSHVEDISATFYDDGEGGLHANVRYDDDGCSFVNEFCLAMPSTGFQNSASLETLLPIAALAVAPGVITSYRRRRNERRATRNV
jgi:pilin isopeptide linkage protein